MNFLGHLALGWPNKNLMIGGFLGDFVKGPLKGDYPIEIEQGIALHRRIDARSDCHPAMRKLKQNLPQNWTRYAGILADLYCDHLISNSKNQLLPDQEAKFFAYCYSTLNKDRELFPESAQRVFKRMYSGRWLEKYASLQFTIASLERIGLRLKFENPLANSDTLIHKNMNLFDEQCPNLYAGMQEVVAEWCSQNLNP